MANGNGKQVCGGVKLGTAMFCAGRLGSHRFGFLCCGLANGGGMVWIGAASCGVALVWLMGLVYLVSLWFALKRFG